MPKRKDDALAKRYMSPIMIIEINLQHVNLVQYLHGGCSPWRCSRWRNYRWLILAMNGNDEGIHRLWAVPQKEHMDFLGQQGPWYWHWLSLMKTLSSDLEMERWCPFWSSFWDRKTCGPMDWTLIFHIACTVFLGLGVTQPRWGRCDPAHVLSGNAKSGSWWSWAFFHKFRMEGFSEAFLLPSFFPSFNCKEEKNWSELRHVYRQILGNGNNALNRMPTVGTRCFPVLEFGIDVLYACPRSIPENADDEKMWPRSIGNESGALQLTSQVLWCLQGNA